jgi:hypothetical protein
LNSTKAYNLLGIDAKSDLNKIRKAYHSKAKEFHPDINKEINAHEKFIEINEAFEFLVKLKTGKVYNSEKDTFEKNKSNVRNKARQNTWSEYESKMARERANEYSKYSYTNFRESSYLKGVSKITVLFPKTILTLGILLAIFIIVIVPILIISHSGLSGIWGYLVIILITFPFLKSLFALFITK